MCGIAGIFQSGNSNQEPVILRMLEDLDHRGPDEAGYFFDESMAVGTVRLAIIDIQSGQQPMTANERFVLSFNGEIFNFIELRQELQSLGVRFRTESDTEVVLQSLLLWGVAAFSRFDGHFAIALYDRENEELLLARDPFGEKPLFIAELPQGIAFSSELKAFRSIPGFQFEMDTDGLRQAAWFWTNLPGQTCFRGISSLRAGHYLTFRNGQADEQRYYSIPKLQDGSPGISEPEAREQLGSLLRTSVERRLRSDVEVGAYLSGGLDSTITSCLAHQLIENRLKTFSVSFEDPVFDESSAQQAVAQFLGTEHHVLKIRPQDIRENFAAVVRQSETPLFRTALTPMYLLSRFVREHGIKVVLTGEGADEFFTGYGIFRETLFRQRYPDFDSDQQRVQALLRLYPYLPHFDEAGATRMLNYFRSHTDPATFCFSHSTRFANSRLSAQLIGGAGKPEDFENEIVREMTTLAGTPFKTMDPLAQCQALELGTLLYGYLLSSQGDRMTSAHSIEGRCPFLNRDLVEFAQSIPRNWKLSECGTEKKILRDSFRDVLPDEIFRRTKQPYRAPDAAPFIGDSDYMDGWVGEELLPASSALDAVFAERLIRKLQKPGRGPISPREDQAFVFMLSTLILEKEYCHSSLQRTRKSLNLKTRIDGRKHNDCERKSA